MSQKKTLITGGVIVTAVVLALLVIPSGQLLAGAIDTDGDGRSITYSWSGADLTVTGNSTVGNDAYEDIEIQADIGQGYEFFGGGASAAWGDAFNPSRTKVCLSTHGLGSGTPVQIVVTYFDASDHPTDTETYQLIIP